MVKKPTLKKIPKKPKQNSSIAVKEKWLKDVKAIKSENKKLITKYNKDLKKDEKLKADLKKTTRSKT